MKRTLFALVLMACASGIALAQKPAAPAAPAPEPTKPAAVIAPVPDSPGQSMIEQDESAMSGRAYSYDPAGRRDPFRSLLVHGIWKTKAGYVAQIRATDNKSYLVRAGDLLYDGEVVRVGPNEVTFRQNINDPQSVKPFREVTKQLNATVKQ
jgi:Tfp pilus assembly protein PilP